MTTSGTVSYNPAFVDIASRVMRQCGVNNELETASASQLAVLLPAANAMIKEWEASGLHVWTEQEAILFLQPGQARYLLGPGTSDHACDATTYVAPQTTSAYAAAATSIALTSVAGCAAGQPVGVVLDNGAMFWTTQSGAASGSTITLSAGLPSSAAAGNFVFSYPADLPRPLKVPNARLRTFSPVASQIRDTPMPRPYSRQQYEDLPNKLAQGMPTAWFYAPLLNQGELKIWQTPLPLIPTQPQALRFTSYRQIQDFNTTSNTLDAPQEWLNAMAWCLSREVGLEFSVTERRWAIIEKMAAEKLEMVTDYDRESEDVQFGFGWDGEGG